MSSVIKWIIGGIAALVVLIVIAMLCVPLFIDPNDYKGKITQAVQEQTGRELSIPGDIELSISPSLKAVFRLGDISLSSSKDFQGTDFFSSELAEINLALWPLIRSNKLQINNIDLKGVNLNLLRNSSGATNWEDLAGDAKKKTKVQKAPPPEGKDPSQKPAKSLPKIDVGGIKIANINVTFTDQQAGRTVKLSNFNLNIGHILEGRPFPFDTNFSLSMDDGKKPMNATTDMSGNLTFDLAKLVVLIDQLKLKTDLEKPMRASTDMSCNLRYDLAKQVLLIDVLKLKTNISEAPVPVKLLGLEMSAEANLAKSLVNVSDLRINVDDTTITGTASITDLKKPSYKAVLHIDQLNLDRYKSEKKSSPAGDTAAIAESAPASSAPAMKKPVQRGKGDDLPIIPVKLLQGLTFDAEINIDKLMAAKLVTTDIVVKTTGKEGLIKLQPFSANLYQGNIEVNGDIDARSAVPRIKLTKKLKGVELAPMFMDLKGKEEIKGRADITAKVSTIGLTKKELTRNANGTMNLTLANGEIAKLKIIDTIRFAKKLYEGGLSGSAATASQSKNQTGRPTSFAELSATGVITNGVIKNDDLLAKSELMEVTGKGTVDLNTERINYLLTIYLAKTLERDEEKDLVEMADTPIPYKVEGTFAKIEQSAALKEVLKAGAIKFLSKELDKQLGGKESKDGAKKDSSSSTEELINKGLKSLFGN